MKQGVIGPTLAMWFPNFFGPEDHCQCSKFLTGYCTVHHNHQTFIRTGNNLGTTALNHPEIMKAKFYSAIPMVCVMQKTDPNNCKTLRP